MSRYHIAAEMLEPETVHVENLGLDEPDVAPMYFGIGHGDYSEETGIEPLYVVWAWIGGEVDVSGVQVPEGMEEEDINERWPEGVPDFGFGIDESGGNTHGSLWGHHVTSETYKGRYEPETGRLTVVKPSRAVAQYRDVPETIMAELHRTFGNVSKVYVF